MEEDVKEDDKKEEKTEAPRGIIGEADKAAERLEKANTEFKLLLEKKEELLAKEKLGGRTFLAVQPIPEKPKSYQEQCKEAVKDLLEKKINPFK